MTLIHSECWWCGKDLDIEDANFGRIGHDCSAKILTDAEMDLAVPLMSLEDCDHFCCGMPENVCRAKTLFRELDASGWKKQ